MFRRLMMSLAAGIALPAPAVAQTPPTAAALNRVVDSLATAAIAGNRAPSVAIAVVRGSDTLVMKGWGKANVELDVPATERSVYRIGSITKQFTAAAVMQLVEQKKVGLGDSIAAHLPALPAAWRPVTVAQLLNHTSGIPSYTGLGASWRRRWAEEMTPDTLLALTAAEPMWFAPGTSYRYDNTGYVLLGMLVEKHAGRPWAADIEERFAKPLGLADTRFCPTEPVIARRVSGYDQGEGGWQNTPFLAMTQPYAAGSLCSTIGDLARCNQALHNGKVVTAASYTAMTTATGAASGRGYGFGLARDSIAGRPAVVHGGGIHGFSASNAWVPGDRLSVTVFTNSSSANSDELLGLVARAALGAPLVDAPPRVVPLAVTDRDRYVGVYALELPNGTRDFTLAAQGDGLMAQLAGQGANPVIHYGNHTFGAAFDPKLRLIFTVEGGKAAKVTLMQGGGRFEGKRR